MKIQRYRDRKDEDKDKYTEIEETKIKI